MPVGLGQLLPGHHLGGHPVPHTGALAALGAGPHPGLGRRGHGGGGDHEGTLIQDEQGALGGEEGEERRMITHS